MYKQFSCFKPTLLFFTPEYNELAETVARNSEGLIELGHLKLDKNGKWPEFKDGWSDLFIQNQYNIKDRDVVFLTSLDTPKKVFVELAVMYALPQYRGRNYKVIVPWFPTGTMERVSRYGEIATAHTMAALLGATPMCATGPSCVCVIDIHALQEQFYFGNHVQVELKTAMGLLFSENVIKPWDIVVFPDDGASKRYKYLFKDVIFKRQREEWLKTPRGVIVAGEWRAWLTNNETSDQKRRGILSVQGKTLVTRNDNLNDELKVLESDYREWCTQKQVDMYDNARMVVCAKQRVGDKRIIVINEGVQNIQDGANCIIVDDMVQSGSTIIECAKELHRHGDLTVNAFCTHGVFPGESWRKFEKQIVNTFYVTNSLPRNNDNYFEHEHPQESTVFKVLSVEPIVSLLCLDTKRTRNKDIAELYES